MSITNEEGNKKKEPVEKKDKMEMPNKEQALEKGKVFECKQPILRLRRIRRILSNLNHVKKKIYLGRTTFHRTADPTLTLILDQSKAASAQIY